MFAVGNARSFWREQLSRDIEPSGLPLDFPRPKTFEPEWAEVPLEIGRELSRAVLKVAGGGPLLTYVTLQAALKLCLSKYNGGRVIVIGSPARKDGLPANALPIVDDVDPALNFRRLLLRVRETLSAAYRHRQYPFEHVVADFNLSAVADKCPLFDVAASSAEIHGPLPEIRGDAVFAFERVGEELRGIVKYRPRLFRRETIENFVAHFLEILRGGLADLERSIGSLEWLTVAERRRELTDWNSTAAPFSDQTCFQRLFESRVAQTPNAVAVSHQGAELTYAALNARANRLARCLKKAGAGPETIVAIFAERSPDWIAAAMAVWKSGAAFLPLDPAYPRDRLAFMLQDSGAPLLLCSPALRDVVPGSAARLLLTTEADENDANLDRTAAPENLAYVIYTSGSTGRPKGVLLTHRGLCNLAETQNRLFDITPKSRVLQFASPCFDAAIAELGTTLSAGATLVTAPAEQLLPGEPLWKTLAEERISHVTLPPTALAVLPCRPLPNLRVLIAAGEPCSGELVRHWAPERRFFNAYGPTEAGVCATAAECHADDALPPIGRPIANMTAYVLDGERRPVPPRVTGELYIGGAGLARGYLNRPELTAERFIPHPFSDDPAARLYRSGDLVRRRASGELEFLGRADRQLKIRGFRVEPEELERVLSAHPAVQDAAVAAREEHPGDIRLVAYYSVRQETDEEELRMFIRERLPDYMLPALFIGLPELPKTPSGKLDRRNLPAPKAVGRGGGKKYVPPRDALELQLTQLWEELLGVSPVGIRDDFFTSGGHSLLTVRLMANIQERMGRRLPLTVLFQRPTIEGLAELLRAEPTGTTWSPLIEIQPHGAEPPLFCIHPTGGTVLCYRELATRLGTHRPFFGLQAFGLEENQTPYQTIVEMAASYAAAIRCRRPAGPYYLAGWSFGGLAAFETARQLTEAGEEVAFLALLDAYSPDVFSEVVAAQDDAAVLTALLGGVLELDQQKLRAMTSARQLEFVVERLRAEELTPSDFGVRQAQRLLLLARQNYDAARNYRPQVWSGRLTLFRACEEKAFAQRFAPNDETLGWKTWAQSGVQVEWVAGTHQTMVLTPHVAELAEKMNLSINGVKRTHANG
jgi:amino acid adenylation domain-containing protein